ncbi:MAG TPA: helix-turn-helix domain-containing GNAT family N-acetyltransferase [Gaiellales bacterium]|nr:helix-turn-helix domain-containing GNAT family N-acetyltransferase [Gaiellales bacterium]
MDSLVAPADRARRFSRFWTREIGLLHEGLLNTAHSLTEARVIYELGQVRETTASALAHTLALDPGHLSRVLAGLESAGLVTRKRSLADGRVQLVSLAASGRRAFAELDRRSAEQASELLERLPPGSQASLLRAMATIEELLGGESLAPSLVIRPPLPGEYGWVVQRHGALYAREYGFDTSFEALAAQIVADYLEHHDPARERCWIAALDGEPVGSVFCVDAGEGSAKLRLLIVEPAARGLQIGTQLVEECIRFARAIGYRELTLWTQRQLVPARRIYERCGFELVAAERPAKVFGTRQVSETWWLPLE